MKIFKDLCDVMMALAIATTLFFGFKRRDFWEITCSFWISYSWLLERRVNKLIKQKYMLNELCFKLIRKYQKESDENE